MIQIMKLTYRIGQIDPSNVQNDQSMPFSGEPLANVQVAVGNATETAGHVQSDPSDNVINLPSGGASSYNVGGVDDTPMSSTSQTTRQPEARGGMSAQEGAESSSRQAR